MPACTNAGVHACKCARVYACILLVCIYASWLCVCSMHLLEVALRSMVATHHSIDSIYTVQAVDATQHMRVHKPVVGKHGVRAAPRAHLRHVIHPFPSPLSHGEEGHNECWQANQRCQKGKKCACVVFFWLLSLFENFDLVWFEAPSSDGIGLPMFPCKWTDSGRFHHPPLGGLGRFAMVSSAVAP